jgi:hypothetical protein
LKGSKATKRDFLEIVGAFLGRSKAMKTSK